MVDALTSNNAAVTTASAMQRAGRLAGNGEALTAGLRRLSPSNCLLLVVVAVVLSFVFNVDNSRGVLFQLAYAISLAVAFSVIVIPRRFIVLPLAAIVMLMPDLTQTAAQVDALGQLTAASIWQVRVGPLTPAVLVFICLSIVLLRMSMVSTLRLHRLVLVYFFGVAIVVSFLFGYPQQSMARFITDFKIALLLYFSLLIFDAYFRTFPEELYRTMQVFLMFLIGAVVYQVLQQYLLSPANDLGLSYEHTSLDSAKGLTLVLTFLAIARIARARRVLFWTAVACATLFIVASYQTRWLILTFILGLAIAFFAIPAKRRLLLALSFTPIFALAIAALIVFESETLRIMLVRFYFLGQVGSGWGISEIEVVRTGAIINSLHQLWEHNAVLTGMGYGSWYTDAFIPMPNLTTGAFDEESLLSGRYYRVHDFTFHFLFKFGIIGLAVYVWLFVRPLRQLWKQRHGLVQRAGGTELLLVFLGLAPTVITYMWFTGKGNIVCGFYIALCTAWVARVATPGGADAASAFAPTRPTG